MLFKGILERVAKRYVTRQYIVDVIQKEAEILSKLKGHHGDKLNDELTSNIW